MTKKWIAINLMLLAGAILLGWQLYVAAKTFNEQNSLANIAKAQPKKKTTPDAGLPPLQPPRKFSDAEFSIIPAQDLFTESRKREEKAEAPPPPETRTLDVKPILIGVLITSSQRLATVLDPAPGGAPGNVPGQRRTLTMRTGDNYRGFTVTDIDSGGMVLEYGASREVIPLFDSSKPPQSGKTPILATRIVSFGPGGGTTGVGATSPTVLVGVQPSAARPASTSTPASGSSLRPGQTGAGGQARGAGGGLQGVVPVGGVQQANQQGPQWNQSVDSQGRTIINSPFGRFEVPIQPTQTTQPVKK